ncbi:hypothetical protein QP185_17880 [Sphingomonas aerolata]|uniref:hypothetical protein n=1 Tax=Sphingomonas aerolata TaxID=185951 RepID=UPI002FE3E51D
MTPLPIDERRIAKLAQACDLIEEERPHGPFLEAAEGQSLCRPRQRLRPGRHQRATRPRCRRMIIDTLNIKCRSAAA